jgi:hypothetical protein
MRKLVGVIGTAVMLATVIGGSGLVLSASTAQAWGFCSSTYCYSSYHGWP